MKSQMSIDKLKVKLHNKKKPKSSLVYNSVRPVYFSQTHLNFPIETSKEKIFLKSNMYIVTKQNRVMGF